MESIVYGSIGGMILVFFLLKLFRQKANSNKYKAELEAVLHENNKAKGRYDG